MTEDQGDLAFEEKCNQYETDYNTVFNHFISTNPSVEVAESYKRILDLAFKGNIMQTCIIEVINRHEFESKMSEALQ